MKNSFCISAYYDHQHRRLWALTTGRNGVVSPVHSLELSPDEMQAIPDALYGMFKRIFAKMGIAPAEDTAMTLVIPPFLSQIQQSNLIYSGKQAGIKYIKLILRTDEISYNYCKYNCWPDSEGFFAVGYISDSGIDMGLYEYSYELLETLAWEYVPCVSCGVQKMREIIVEKFEKQIWAVEPGRDVKIEKLILCGKDFSQTNELSAGAFAAADSLGWNVLCIPKDAADIARGISGYFFFEAPILISASKGFSIMTGSGTHSIRGERFLPTPSRSVAQLIIPEGAADAQIAVCCGGELCLYGTAGVCGNVEININTDISGAISATMLTADGERELTPIRGKCPVFKRSRLPEDTWFF